MHAVYKIAKLVAGLAKESIGNYSYAWAESRLAVVCLCCAGQDVRLRYAQVRGHQEQEDWSGQQAGAARHCWVHRRVRAHANSDPVFCQYGWVNGA